jgi:hypothetical protein
MTLEICFIVIKILLYSWSPGSGRLEAAPPISWFLENASSYLESIPATKHQTQLPSLVQLELQTQSLIRHRGPYKSSNFRESHRRLCPETMAPDSSCWSRSWGKVFASQFQVFKEC